MLSQALLAPPALFQVSPPYDHFEAVPDPSALAPENLQDASLLAVGVGAPEDVWSDVRALVPQLRARYPAAPVVLRVARHAEAGDGEWEQRAADLRVRALVYDGDRPADRLRHALTRPLDLSSELTEWLPLRLPGIPAAIVDRIGDIAQRAAQFAEVGALLASVGRAERTVRTWFRRAGVPGPGKWLAVTHALRAARRLQSEDHAPLLALAVECGYSDHSSLSRQSLRLFGLRPGAIRRTLGWEWLVDRWLKKGDTGIGQTGDTEV